MDVGNVLVVREDEKDLDVEQLRLLCYFRKRKLRPLFDDAAGAGLVRRTKQEVLDFITPDNLENFRDELSDGEDFVVADENDDR